MLSVRSNDVGTLLLAEQAKLSATDRVAILSAVDPALAVAVAQDVASVDVYDMSNLALRRAEQQIGVRAKGTNARFSEDVFPPAGSDYDAALMTIPNSRQLMRAQLWSALKSLRPRGRLYIAGPTQTG